MHDRGSRVRFPAISFGSQGEFDAYRKQHRATIDARYAHERALAQAPGLHERAGTCAPCLRQVRFTVSTERGERLDDDRVLPAWREQLVCDCADRLSNRHRAILHFVESIVASSAWHRVVAFGRTSPTEVRLYRRLGETLVIPRLLADAEGGGSGGFRLALPDRSCHLAISLDTLHQVPPLASALAELRRVLIPGGALVFTVPFRWDRQATRSHVDATDGARLAAESPREVHEIGWDVLAMLTTAGFARSRAHVYWSDELGYLGPFNTIFSAET